jgi:pSer/pThr/pTyr-binding forkhead associated (FHA) protein
MRDGRTRRVQSDGDVEQFLTHNQASLTLLKGPAAGSEFPLTEARTLIGRSSAAGIQLDDRSVSHEHASIELGPEGFGVRDLASTNGVRVNGAAVETSDLKHGDRLEIGGCELQYVVESRGGGRTWQLDVD